MQGKHGGDQMCELGCWSGFRAVGLWLINTASATIAHFPPNRTDLSERMAGHIKKRLAEWKRAIAEEF